ncbi:sporulation protein [Heyndrickxia vini]|uniref:Sporulation protein n=1 Tax=Heyndrickxia vini TaxID=1476025 RepID=A0ABX7E7D6_9BACI|nr:sporulation protein [Heyndrickxia vini]QQZ11203.1 sporulation protein [Heyndrickxia vini]
MDTTLAYLRESLSNHLNHRIGEEIYKKLHSSTNQNELEFVRNLSEDETAFLNSVLAKEIRYAQDEQDQTRVTQLNEVYELLL